MSAAEEELITLLSGGHDSVRAAMQPVARRILDVHAEEIAQVIQRENPDHDVDWSDGVDWATGRVRVYGKEGR